MSDISSLDIILVATVVLSALAGIWRGFVREVLSLLTWLCAFLGALYFGPWVAEWLDVGSGNVRAIVGYAAIFLVVLVVGVAGQKLMAWLTDAAGLTGIDRALGLAFGVSRGLLICLVALIAIRPFFEDADWWRAAVLPPVSREFEDKLHELVAGVNEDLNLMPDGVRL